MTISRKIGRVSLNMSKIRPSISGARGPKGVSDRQESILWSLMDIFREGVPISEPGIDMPPQLEKLQWSETTPHSCLLMTRTLGFQPNGFTQDPVRIRGHQAIVWGSGRYNWKTRESRKESGDVWLDTWLEDAGGLQPCHWSSNSPSSRRSRNRCPILPSTHRPELSSQSKIRTIENWAKE